MFRKGMEFNGMVFEQPCAPSKLEVLLSLLLITLQITDMQEEI